MNAKAAWDNAVLAMPTDSLFVADLSGVVTNDNSPDGAARWLLSMAASALEKSGVKAGPIQAYDFAIGDIEKLVSAWTAFHFAADTCPVPAKSHLPALARFLVERLPSLWNDPVAGARHPPATRTLVLADRIDTLVGMFAAGLAPNGSKDPYALRRAARHVLANL